MMAESMVRLSDLCTLVAEPVDPGERPDAVYVGLEHLATGRFTRIGAGQASDVRSSKMAFGAGDILYGKLRPYLDKAVLVCDEGICTTELLVLRPKEGINPHFLTGVVHTPAFVEYAVSGTTGVQHPRTSWAHIREFLLPVSILKEQDKIAGMLWLTHEAIAACQTTLETAHELKRATMRTLFTRGLRGEAQKETEIGPMPESWETVPVAGIAEVKGGKRMPKGVSLTVEKTGTPYIRVTDFHNHSVEVDQVRFVPRGYETAIARYTISKADVYISIAGTIGLVGQVPQRLDGANLTENAAKITSIDPRVVTRFLMYALASIACQSQIVRATGRNAQPKLALTRFERIELPLPLTLDEQHEIVAILDAIDRKIDLHRRKRAVLDELFKALLHKLMTGEISVSDLHLSAVDRVIESEFSNHEGNR